MTFLVIIMTLTVLGTAANVFGVVTPAKDSFEIFKYIVDSLEEVVVYFNAFVRLLLTTSREDKRETRYHSGMKP